MRTLTSTLLAAQQAASAEPYVRVRLSDLDVGVPRLRWTRWYSGAEAAGPCGVAVAGDGALLRARIDAATGALSHQRVAGPSAGSTYSAWTSLGSVHAGARVGFAAAGTRALIATVRSGGTGVEVRESTDSGASFGASSLLTTTGGAVTAIACTLQASGTAAVVFAWGGAVYAMRRTGLGVWSVPALWPHALASVSGLAATFESDHQVIVSGVTSAGAAGAWSCILGAGGSMPPGGWSALHEVAGASAGTNVSYLATGVTWAGGPRATFVESYSGGGAYQRLHLASGIATTAFIDQAWRDAQPLDLVGAHGAGCAATGSDAYLATPSGVWHAPISVAVSEIGDDVIELDLRQGLTSGRLRLALRNDDGRYLDGNAPAALVPGGELWVDPGYVTTAGAESSEGMRWWITSVRRRAAGGRATVEVDAVDGWGLLGAWRASRQLAWAGTASAESVIADVAARAGLRLASGGTSAESAAWSPSFTLRAGESAATGIERLTARLADVVLMRGLTPTLREPLVADATDYAYGTSHAILDGRVEAAPPGPGWTRVFGRGVFAEAVDIVALQAGGGVAVAVDDSLAAQARVDARATSLLRKAAIEAVTAEVVVPPNVGQEVGDVVEVTSAGLGLVAARYRVAALRLRWSRGRQAAYEQTLSLSAV
ncbi:MAG: hypothetical protein WC211_02710 [Dehalococcoidia bacterium]